MRRAEHDVTGPPAALFGDLSTTARFDAGTEVWNSSATASQLRQALGLQSQ